MDSYEKILSEIGQLANRAVTVCRENGYKLATAESCTGGMISAAITAVSGSSAVIELGVCSYSNRIKHDILGVSTAVLEAHTEYSLQCAEEMAAGVIRAAGADFGVSTTGVAGPTGGTSEHPVGEVFIGVSAGGAQPAVVGRRFVFKPEAGNNFTQRDFIRAAAARQALTLLLEQIENAKPQKGENNG